MTYSYTLLDEAQEEYESSIAWYKERSASAAEHFIDAIDETIELICSNPDRWRNRYTFYRELTVKKYPFNIVYVIDEIQKEVVIHSIYHHSRDPEEKYRN